MEENRYIKSKIGGKILWKHEFTKLMKLQKF